MLDKLKQIFRISITMFDTELLDLIDSAEADLVLAGVHQTHLARTNDIYDDNLIERAVIVYAKWMFGWNNPDSEKFQMAYDSLKRHLTLSEEYLSEVV